MSHNDDWKEYIKLNDFIQEGKKIKPAIEDSFIPSAARPLLVFENGAISEMYLSQSFIKELAFKWEERADLCPWKIKNTWVERNFRKPVSDAMLRGEYFETKTLGGGIRGKQTALPMHKTTGKKTVVHDRIDDAIQRFLKVKEDTGIIVTKRNTQVNIEKPWMESSDDIKVVLQGTADIISPFLYDYMGNKMEFEVAVLDTKLTQDREVCFQDAYKPWQSFCWGCPEKMDHIQGIFYSTLFELPFIYLIFDYRKDDPGWKPVAVNSIMLNPNDQEAKNRQKEFEQGIRWTIQTVKNMHEMGWQKCPGEWCAKCPVITCEFKSKMDIV
jgi:hypothetical protein